MDFAGLFDNAATGGLLGGIFSMVGGWLTHKQQIELARMQLEARAVEQTHEVALLGLQMEAARAETEAQIDLSDTQGSWEGLKASYTAEAATGAGTYRWVEAVRQLTRPALTLAALGGTGFVGFTLNDPALQAQAVDTLTFLSSTSAAWWFGDRVNARARARG
jgi:hypothetical protein